ncbi:MAG: T9SS type A sorting domain-containing protein [Flaviramulus sp.]|nr:T9SS-dependent M36 family metallopeptidase [Flaviramulus sp.]NNC51287.1 T9SS type A sorting domain-containing protein [Flaviramulus sp.]
MKSNYIKSFLPSMLFLLLAYSVVGQSDLKDSNYATVIKNYLTSSNNMAKFSNADLEDLYVNKEIFSKKTKVTNVYLNQRYKGVKIFNAISSVAIKDNTVFHFADRFKVNIGEKVNAVSESLSARDAISKVAQHFNLGSVSGLEVIEKGNNKFKFTKGNISQEDIAIEKVYFEDKDGTLKLAWNLNIYTIDGSHWWSVRVDALRGKILNANDWVVSCNFGNTPHTYHSNNINLNKKSFNLFEANKTILVDGSQYNVFALPTESPNHGARQLVTEPANPNASPYGWHDINGVAGAEFTDTRGNNVLAQDDADNNNSGGSRPNGGSALNFDFSLDLNEQPDVSIDASITNLFYMNNMIHDIFYEYGFDEVSGNFQQKNYSGAPGQSDPVAADGLDGGGLNNANFSTPPDGARPRMQMYLWNKLSDVLTINNGSLSGGYIGTEAGFGASLTDTPLTNDLALVVDDDSGASTDPNDACDVITNALSLAGKIAVIRRGECEFGFKVLAAENAGAVAVVIVNNTTGLIQMGPGADGDSVTIPSIMIEQSTGDAIISALENGDSISASLVRSLLIDGNYDNGVIGHEYGHGISTRLTGGSDNSDCLISCTEYDTEGNCIGTFTEQMGEGWSDWVALVTTMKSSDFGTDGRGIATFDSNQPIDGPGIRPYRYSTDTSINPSTYSDTNNTASFSAPHGVGSIWATMLWDLTWAYIDKYGFDADLFNGTGGNNKVMQIVLDGMKLQPCNPGFVDGRDAILAADLALTGGEDQCIIWDVFAARGLGVNATQGSSLVRTDQTQNFETPDPNDPSLANCTTLSSESFNSNDFRIYPNPTSDKFTIKSTRSLGDVTLELIDINGRKMMSKKATLIGEVELNLKSLSPGLYILKIKGEYINASEKIIKK